MPINQPSNQNKLVNIAVVRLKKKKQTFEVACYPNKVQDWRKEIELKLENVLQKEDTVFANVGKGEVASKKDIEKAFGKVPLETVIREILKDGVLQVGSKERQADLDRIRHEVVNIVAGMLVDPKTKRVYTPTMIEKALEQLSVDAAHQKTDKNKSGKSENNEDEEEKEKRRTTWTGVRPKADAKKQALIASRCLVFHQPIPVMRARMKLKVTCAAPVLKYSVKTAAKSAEATDAADGPEPVRQTVKEAILGFFENKESDEVIGDEWEVTGFVEPGNYKGLSDFLGSQTKGRGRVEVLEQAIVHEDD